MQARGFVRDAAEVGRVWGSFRRSRFRREGGDVFGFHTETSTGRPYRRTSTSTDDSRARPRRFGPPRRGRASRVNFVDVSHCSMASCSIWRLPRRVGRVNPKVWLIDVTPSARPTVRVSWHTIMNCVTVNHHRTYGWGAWYPNLPFLVSRNQDFDNQLNW